MSAANAASSFGGAYISVIQTPIINFKRHRFAPQIIAHAVWLCLRFPVLYSADKHALAMFGIWTKSWRNVREPSSDFGALLISTAPFSKKILQKWCGKEAAKRLLIALLKRYGFAPKRIITDKLCSYGAAMVDVAPSHVHWSHKGLN